MNKIVKALNFLPPLCFIKWPKVSSPPITRLDGSASIGASLFDKGLLSCCLLKPIFLYDIYISFNRGRFLSCSKVPLATTLQLSTTRILFVCCT